MHIFLLCINDAAIRCSKPLTLASFSRPLKQFHSLQLGSDKTTVSALKECAVATEELQTFCSILETDIKAFDESTASISNQVEQLEELFRKFDHLFQFIRQVCRCTFF
ncbi:unnamed protein product [Gongylonema pulchrum]|uniref:FH2 domain-containing protein n=1 Tax=Gongylonema pulchrum TaxID=637853 RepID=A0A183DPZ1_9BILA|nr:unnamed protein product [Gongylonema pulchrum]